MKAEPCQTEPFTLLKEQIPHFHRVLDRVNTVGFYADNSVMGCGKTYVAVAVGQALEMNLFVVCPLTVHASWQRVAEQAGVDMVAIITPQSLASRRGCQPKHGYLSRKERKGGPLFTPTSKLKKVVKAGTLFVFDEIQFARNINTYFLASKAIVRCVGLFEKARSDSRCAFISTTPFDRVSKCAHFLMLINLFKGKWIKKRDVINPKAVRDLHAFCEKMGIVELELPTTLEGFYRFFLDHIQPRVFSSMPLLLNTHCDIRNGFYKITSSKEKKGLMEAIGYLNGIFMRLDPETLTIPLNVLKKLMVARMKIEKAKIPLFKRLITKELKSGSKRKVVMCVHFTDTITRLQSHFSRLDPLVLHGQVKKKNREDIIQRFQRPSVKHRLLICNIRVGGVGISLHDLHGSYPRSMFISPDHNVTDIFQATGRINRVGGKSDSRIRLVYANLPICERSIVGAIARRMHTIKETLDASVREELKLPTDFEDYIEGKQLFVIEKK